MPYIVPWKACPISAHQGTKRLDLCVHYQGLKYPIELKLRYSQKTYTEGKDQLAGYMDKLGCTEGWLIVLDRRKKTPWSKKSSGKPTP